MGIFRFILSVLVVNGHLNTIAWPAAYAVFSFYLISGYLMTLIMNTRYGYTPRGIILYLTNRILRIYPTYYVAVALSLVAILLVPSNVIYDFNQALIFPNSLIDLFKNIFIIGLDSRDSARLVPPSWALYNELFYYFAIGIFLGRNKEISLLWFLLSVIYIPALCVLRPDICTFFYHRYSTIFAASLPFSIGCCLFHYSKYIYNVFDRIKPGLLIIVSMFLYVSNYLAAFYFPVSSNFYFYANLGTTAFLLASIFYQSSKQDRKSLVFKIDSVLGELSYPIYLFHWQSAIIMAGLLGFQNKSSASFLLGLAVSIILGLLEINFLSKRVCIWRGKIKRSLLKPT